MLELAAVLVDELVELSVVLSVELLLLAIASLEDEAASSELLVADSLLALDVVLFVFFFVDFFGAALEETWISGLFLAF